jgi:site-specific recombinase XerD
VSLVAPTLQSFFTDRLLRRRQVSPRTIVAYRDSLRLLLSWVHDTKRIRPDRLDWADLDADTITRFLDHLERERNNTARTRNLRLTAIRSLFSYASLTHPEHAEVIRVLAIPPKRFDRPEIRFLTQAQLAVLLAAPDQDRWEGRRDRALLALTAQAGLRVGELTGLNVGDITLAAGANVRCLGKGRKHRAVPLNTTTSTVLSGWLTERAGLRDEPLFPTRTGRRLSPDAVERLVRKHSRTAASDDPSFPAERVHPHMLRHTCAMNLLHSGVDTAVIALWPGHADIRSTAAYLHADMTIKEQALQRMATTDVPAGRYRPGDKLLAFLDGL